MVTLEGDFMGTTPNSYNLGTKDNPITREEFFWYLSSLLTSGQSVICTQVQDSTEKPTLLERESEVFVWINDGIFCIRVVQIGN